VIDVPDARQHPSHQSPETNDLQLLDDLLQTCYDALVEEVGQKPKLGDFLKMIELRRKLTPHDESQKELWALLERTRQEKLSHGTSDGDTMAEPDSEADNDDCDQPED
jgi:hypothetical protein